MKVLKHKHALFIVPVGLERRPTESVRYMRFWDCVAFNTTGSTPMRIIQVLLVRLTLYCRSPIRQRNSRILEVSWRYKVLNMTHAEWPCALYEACRALSIFCGRCCLDWYGSNITPRYVNSWTRDRTVSNALTAEPSTGASLWCVPVNITLVFL